ncbi:MAG: carbohydrate ABC transporter permease [Clostridia bacterium]|nr:carbohydrate ABC transporter permease [Clostridia bacterium]
MTTAKRLVRKDKRWKPSTVIAFFILAVLSVIWIYPFIWMLSASFKTNLEILNAGLDLIPRNINTDAYRRAWVDAHFNTYFMNSVITTAATILIVVIRCALAGYVLALYEFRGKKLIIGLMIVTFFVPTSTTLIPTVVMSRHLNLLNTRIGLILALSGGGQVASTLLYRGFFKQTPYELVEAAELDGASFLQVFCRVMLPLTGPITATTIVMTFMGAWNNFMLPLVFTFSNASLRTLPVGMMVFSKGDMVDYAGQCAAALLSIAPIVVVYVFCQKYFVSGIAGAIKS